MKADGDAKKGEGEEKDVAEETCMAGHQNCPQGISLLLFHLHTHSATWQPESDDSVPILFLRYNKDGLELLHAHTHHSETIDKVRCLCC